MKTIKNLLAVLAIAALPALFTACDDDPWDPWYNHYGPGYGRDYDYHGHGNGNSNDDGIDIVAMAQTLRGHWTGTTVAKFYDENGILKTETYSTDIEFDQTDDNTSGRGLQNDYIGDELKYSRRFSWYIDSKTWDIVVTYDGGEGIPAFQMIISYDDLSLDSRTFVGTMVGEGETDEFDYERVTYAKKVLGDE